MIEVLREVSFMIYFCIALNSGQGIYFFTPATKQDKCLLLEGSCSVYNL